MWKLYHWKLLSHTYPCLTLPFGHLLADPMLARPRMSVTQWVRPRQGILIRSILPLFLFTPHKMTRAGEGEGRRFALNCGPTSERKRKTKRVPFGERRAGSTVPGCNVNMTRVMYTVRSLWTCILRVLLFFNTVQTQALIHTRIHSPLWTHTRTPYPYEHLRKTEPAYHLEIYEVTIGTS